MDLFEELLARAVRQVEVTLDDRQIGQLSTHFRMMVEANRAINLTRITDSKAAAVKHYADSLALLPWASREGVDRPTVLDVGTGAGFPAISLAVARPDWSVTALDGTRKKIEFLNRVQGELRLENLKLVHAHSDHWKTGKRFSLVVLRAAAKLAKSLESGARFLNRKGWLVAFKTAELNDLEDEETLEAAARLRLLPQPSFFYTLQIDEEQLRRSLRIFQRSVSQRG